MATKAEELERLARGEGCLGKAADDEPLFILRAQDWLAPALVELWAERAGLHGVGDAKVEGALAIAAQMRDWAKRHRGKWPD